MMSLSPGTQLGHYEIVEAIGKGGMGEVYRARDSKLGRDVAIKVLPEAFTQDKDRLERFEREARLLAQLNHSNVATLYGVEESERRPFLVMELVEGETLAERIARGPMPLDEALHLFRQIAEGVEAAHEKGIIHRDLKPANIKISPDDTPKILDFGLAKAFAEKEATTDASQSPTLTKGTALGVILGTAAYMSPEQARGSTLDKRTDIWAFGCCLYEALTGKKTFAGETVTDTLAAVMRAAPEWTALPTSTPTGIRTLLRRCLEKKLKERLPDIGSARLEIRDALNGPDVDAAQVVPVARNGQKRPLGAIATFLAGSLIAGLAASSLWPEADGRPVTRLSVAVNGALTPKSVSPALSPDGLYLAYAANNQLYVRAMDELETKPLAGTDGGRSPFFSPDSEWIAFFTASELKKIPVRGGATQTLARVRDAISGAWGPDDRIFFQGEGISGLFEVSATGGEPTAFTTPAEGEAGHSEPEVLPGGGTVLFTIMGGASADDVWLEAQSIASGERALVLRGGESARYASSGHLVYVRDGSLFAVPFDPDRLEVTGTSALVVEGVASSRSLGQYSVSRSGSLAYLPGTASALFGWLSPTTLVWVDRDGREEPLPAEPRPYAAPRVSPDGTRLTVVAAAPDNVDLWMVDTMRATTTRFTFDPGFDWMGAWTPDGLRVVFDSTRGGEGGLNIFSKRADGTGQVERLTVTSNRQHPFSFTPDGKVLVFEEHRISDTGWDLIELALDGEPAMKPLLDSVANERAPAIARDGRWIAYQSDESGRDEIYVRPYPDVTTGRWQVSIDGGRWPVWESGSSELFYISAGGMMAVPIETNPVFRVGASKLLFELEGYAVDNPDYPSFDVSPDGERFLMLKSANTTETSEPTEFHVVLNWFEELERLVPTED